MIPARSPRVLLQARRRDTAQQWRASLLALGGHVWLSEAELGPDDEPEVIVTDRADAPLGDVPAAEGVVKPAVLGIGNVPGADCQLAADATDRELQLACRLLAEIVALRRQRDELAQFGRRVTQLADTDPLTGLPNRRVWQRRLATLLAQRSHADVPLWLAIVDLDRFKQVNDQTGMQRGDEVLVQAGQALVGGLRRDDLVARLGGDEFGLLLVGATAENLATVFERLRTALSERAQVTASIGYVAVDPGTPGAELFAAAECAMRLAKQAGGDSAVEAEPPGSLHPPADVE